WGRALRRLRPLLGSNDRQLLRLATEGAPGARRGAPPSRASRGLLVQKPQSPAALAEPGVTFGRRPAIRTRPELLLLPGGAPSKAVRRRIRPSARRVRSGGNLRSLLRLRQRRRPGRQDALHRQHG